MTSPSTDPLNTILQRIAEAAPGPWYPSEYARGSGIVRDSLDLPLERLRLSGLIRLTDWVKGLGQGYVLTPEGNRFLEAPHAVLQAGDAAREGRPHAPAPSVLDDPALRRRARAVLAALKGWGKPRVAWSLLLINFLFFGYALYLAHNQGRFAAVLNGPMFALHAQDQRAVVEILARTGAIHNAQDPAIYLRQSSWRLLTACFVHLGWMHLAANMFSLLMVGPMLERMWGHGRFLVLYLIAGLGGSCAMVVFERPQLGAGASGALCGLVASLPVWLFLNRRVLRGGFILFLSVQLIVVVGLNVMISLKVPHISHAGHLGGAVAGFLVAVPLHFSRWGRGWQKWLAPVGIVGVPLLFLGMVYKADAVAGKQVDTAALQKAANQVYERASSLVRLSPDLRKPDVDDVSQVIEQLHIVGTLLDQAANSMQGTLQSDPTNRAEARYLQERAKLFALAAEQLEKSVKNLNAINQQEKEVGQAESAWKKLQKAREKANQQK